MAPTRAGRTRRAGARSRPAARTGRTKPPRPSEPSKREKLRQAAEGRSIEALRLMRKEKLSLAKAAAAAGTTPRTMHRHVGRALMQTEDGRYVATKYDRIPRTLRFLTPKGQISLTVRDSRTASRIADYWAAVNRFLRTGDRRGLWPFRRMSIRVDKVGYPFVTDAKTLERLAFAGEVSFEDLYTFHS